MFYVSEQGFGYIILVSRGSDVSYISVSISYHNQ